MTEQDASPPQHHNPRRAARQSPALDRDRTPSFGHSIASIGPESSLPTATLTSISSNDPEPLGQRHLRQGSMKDDEHRRSRGVHRSHKQRSSGAFLLADSAFGNLQDRAAQLPKRSRNSAEIHKSKAVRQGNERTRRRGPESDGGEGLGLGLGLTPDSLGPGVKHDTSGSTSSTVTKRDSLAGETAVGSSPRTSIGPLDVEAAQIVNMALNLSESRRLASRRNVSTPVPPKLTPLPDSATGGSLRQHLQQQRRVSRTISPKPDRTPRLGSGRVLSPLQSSYEPEGNYRYHFSQSTLARAQKAKEYIELMAQYRRVLDLLPPLKPSRTARSSTVSPPDSPSDSVQVFRLPSNENEPKIGRPYNPLQYIRNRKVRARERKVIDGEVQGFHDVIRVSEWVDEVAKWVATGQFRAPGNTALPPYAAADLAGAQSSPPSTQSRPTMGASKPKRPRVDWVIEPADAIADIYWLELDDNKKLVEDRHWRRVFPQGADLYRPLSREEPGPLTTTPVSMKDSSTTYTPAGTAASDSQVPKSDHEHVLSTARDRAQQKLRALKGAHHRQNSSTNGRDFLRVHRGSLSESSDTDSDRRRRARTGAISSDGKDILAKQMDAIIAREQRDAESHPLYDHDALRMKSNVGLATPEREKPNLSRAPSRTGSHRRVDSRAELSDAEGRYFKLRSGPSPPQLVGRASLEVPSIPRGRRFSVDYDTSQPNSPDLRAVRDNALVPAIGMDLSPTSSRPTSPSRNPLTKVKSIFRDRSGDRFAEMHLHETEDGAEVPSLQSEKPIDSPGTDRSTVASPERRASRSPLRKIVSRGTDTSHRSHRSTGSIKLRGEDGGSGLRSLFRGPRIDSVLRSGVSKVSDIIWRKEPGAGADEQTSSTSSDESDVDQVRGRPRDTVLALRPPSDHRNQNMSAHSGKSYLDVMPQFAHTGEHGKFTRGEQGGLTVPDSHPASTPLSRRSSRFDLLKPPKIDIQNTSPTSTPPPEAVRGADGSETDSRKSSYTEGVRAADARLNAILQHSRSRQFSSTSSVRQWSLAERERPGGAPPARTVVSRREIARLRASLLSSGIHAMEMDRRAKERKLLTSPKLTNDSSPPPDGASRAALSWAEVAKFCPDPAMKSRLLTRSITQIDLYPVAARVLGSSIQMSAQQWQTASDKFASETAPQLEHRVENLRGKLAGELTDLTRSVAEEADEAYTDLVTGQRLKVKRVVDFIEKMLRRRRRRFRWVRRAGWLAVEWALVGFMWYVWFVVMIARVVLGAGKGVVGVVRWLLWL
ncbi:hypothetical protein B0H66DRAFT_507578 [Apodospora peruviana]|uniref:Uncharacterized protein n=1 Tax=Apodospora peruviana TaxID=516989 RepID=A0AAE0ME55_9PEZI|nr:hypothetical protein B0H66DRAFT_507578 [Apodospora peruviana]